METKLFSTSVNSPLLQKLKTYLAEMAVMMPKIQMLSFLILLFALVSTLKMTLMLVTLLVSKSWTVMDSSMVFLSSIAEESVKEVNITLMLPQCAVLTGKMAKLNQYRQKWKRLELATTLSCMIQKLDAQSSVCLRFPDSSTSTHIFSELFWSLLVSS